MSNFFDMLTIPFVIFIVAIVFIVMLTVFNAMADGSDGFLDPVKGVIQQSMNLIINLMPFVLLMMSLGAIVSALLIRTHPIFFGVSILLIVIQLIITPMITNMWSSIMTGEAAIQATADNYPVILLFFDKLPLITFVLAFIVGIVSYIRGMQQ